MVATISHDQNEFLINYMKIHTEFAARRFMRLNGNRAYVSKWKEVTDILNGLGPQRSLLSWMRVS